MTEQAGPEKQTPDPRAAEIGAEADRWVLLFAERALTADEARAFNSWITANPEHERMFRAAQSGMRELAHLRGMDEYRDWIEPSASERLGQAASASLSALRRILASKWSLGLGGAAAASLCALLVLTILPFDQAPVDPAQPIQHAPDFVTAVAEIRTVALPDGSQVTLGAASSLDVDFTEAERRVVLGEGEAFFEVEGDAAWPFIVVAGDTLVRVVGTQFDVRRAGQAVEIAVLEGEVEVIQPDGPVDAPLDDRDVRHVLVAGQQVAARAEDRVQPVRTINPDTVGAWRRGELMWADTPVRDIIADLNRYAPSGVRLEAEEIGDLEYTLAVQADDTQSAIELIAASLDLEISQDSEGVMVLQVRDR